MVTITSELGKMLRTTTTAILLNIDVFTENSLEKLLGGLVR